MPFGAGTTLDSIYSMIGSVIQTATARVWWDKRGIQAQPSGTYATVYLTLAAGLEWPFTENIPLSEPTAAGEWFEQVPRGAALVDCQIEFLRSGTNDSAIQAAKRFDNALRLDARWYDLWTLCALSGGTRMHDISAIFRADIEPRARVEFQIYANLIDQPLEDVNIYDIHEQLVQIDQAVENKTVTVTVTNTSD